jgi:hypothetical protein
MHIEDMANSTIVMAKSGFINLEFNWGRWNGDDVRSLEEPLVALVVRVGKDQTAI